MSKTTDRAKVTEQAKEIARLSEMLREERAARLRATAEALKKYAVYDTELALLRKQASESFTRLADVIDPPPKAKGKDGSSRL